MPADASFWDLEDDLGGAASAQLNVADEATDDDVPWPRARTPEPDEFSVDRLEAARVAGFGEAPSGFLFSPVYFLRARAALVALKEKKEVARKNLAAEERRRDRSLAELAEACRPLLQKSERLSELLREADRWEQEIGERRRSFVSADREGAQKLAGASDEVTTTESRVRELVAVATKMRAEEQSQLTEVRRAIAQLKRIEIERRNVADQARALVPVGHNMPPHLAERYLELGHQRDQAEEVVRKKKELHAASVSNRKAAEEAERRARADLGRTLAAKEGLLVAQEGIGRTYADSLEEAEEARLLALAEAGRSIVQLRGEVPVDKEVRRTLIEADRLVREAARRLEICVHAEGTLDDKAFKEGRMVLTGLAVLCVLLLVYLASPG